MKELRKIGMFFIYWIATIIGCFLTLFVTRFFTHQFDITTAISVSNDNLAKIALVFVIVGLLVAGNLLKVKK